MRLYHFTSRNYGLSNLTLRRLKVATLDDINDPFELESISLSNPRDRAVYRRFKAEWSKKFGMLCFSRSWSNPVQWSHYGEKHRGVCLGFDVDDRICSPVSYSDSRLSLDLQKFEFNGGEDTEKAAISWSTTKFSHWSYEEEVRVFLALNERGDSNFYWCPVNEQIQLREIIIGPKSNTTRSDIISALGEDLEKISVITTRLAFKSYRVVRQKRQDLWK